MSCKQRQRERERNDFHLQYCFAAVSFGHIARLMPFRHQFSDVQLKHNHTLHIAFA